MAAAVAAAAAAAGATWSGRLGAIWTSLWENGAREVDALALDCLDAWRVVKKWAGG